MQTLSERELDREELKVQSGNEVYAKPVAMPDGTVVRLMPAEGWDFNPGKQGLTRAGIA